MDYVNCLPDHILVEIIGNLSPRMIKCCALVCKRWNKIIGTSLKLMERFQLDLDKATSEILGAEKPKRKYRAAIVRNLGNSLDFISRQNLQSLEIGRCLFTKISTLIEVLNNLPLLKVFVAEKLVTIDDLSEISDNMKKVRINIEQLNCLTNIIYIFGCCTVKALKTSCMYPVDDIKKKMAFDFLKQQRNLEDLDLFASIGSEFLALPDIYEYKFPLKKFKFNNFGQLFLDFELFIRFLNQYKESLTSLELGFSTEPSVGIEHIHKYALENIVGLKHLKMGCFETRLGHLEHTFSYELPAATQITRSMESLGVMTRSSDMDENKRFYNMFPNLKYLEINVDTKFVVCISKICINVEKLDLQFLNDVEDDIYFPKLKELSLQFVQNEKSVVKLIKRHSQTLEKLYIKNEEKDLNFFELTYLIAIEILNCPNLYYLEVGIDKCDKSFSIFEMLNTFSLRTKPFTLFLSGYLKPFKFPDDKVFWAMEVEKAKNIS